MNARHLAESARGKKKRRKPAERARFLTKSVLPLSKIRSCRHLLMPPADPGGKSKGSAGGVEGKLGGNHDAAGTEVTRCREHILHQNRSRDGRTTNAGEHF